MSKSKAIPKTHSQIIDRFGGPLPFSKAIKITDSHARTMKARDSIPSEWWAPTADAAKRMKVEGVTFEVLARIEAAKAGTQAS